MQVNEINIDDAFTGLLNLIKQALFHGNFITAEKIEE